MKKQLAIKGHETRGKEVIEILQMLGGKKTIYSGKDTFHIYSLNDSMEITSEFYREDSSLTSLTYDVFTLEEFLEKYPYKIGDKVSLDNKLRLITWMCWECNKIYYMVQGIDDMFTKKVTTDELKPYKEVKNNNMWKTDKGYCTSNRNVNDICDDILIDKISAKVAVINLKSDVCDDEVEIVLGDYEIVVRDGKTYAIKKKLKYPTTFIEVLNFWHPDRQIEDDYQRNYKKDIIENFQNLLYARDAYWKIAGEEMGLGKSWEPDWREKRYIIYRNQDNIIGGYRKAGYVEHHIFEFPSAEMRDAFYENFKSLIEDCKEFL